jgi:phosphatidate cytidylyltransferase
VAGAAGLRPTRTALRRAEHVSRTAVANYRTRLGVGSLLVVGAVVLLAADDLLNLAPYYPGLLVCLLGLGTLATLELHALLAGLPRAPGWLLVCAVLAVLLSNWYGHLPLPWERTPWAGVAGTIVGAVIALFLYEMAVFRTPGDVVVRLALAVWVVVYLALTTSFLAQLRWWPSSSGGSDHRGLLALLLTIFVPKSCDIGAYFAGSLFGRHPLTPILSPKKTWEGLIGGLVFAALTAVVLNRVSDPGTAGPILGDDGRAAAFGVSVGVAAVMGDLAESLVKRDRGHKDASRLVPGFGGVLDVIDSVLFAAPVAYWWMRG